MAVVGFSYEDLEQRGNEKEDEAAQDARPSYWRAENHTTDNYLRADAWVPDIERFLFPSERRVVPLRRCAGRAILRFVEEMKMFANLEQEKRNAARIERVKEDGEDVYMCDTIDYLPTAFHDPSFLDEQEEAILQRWQKSTGESSEWYIALKDLEMQLDEKVRFFVEADTAQYGENAGAFVKLSVRSPKDAVYELSSFPSIVRNYILHGRDGDSQSENMVRRPEDEEALSDTVAAIKYAAWQCLRVRNGREALRLLLRSERVYLDVLQHDLFNASTGAAAVDAGGGASSQEAGGAATGEGDGFSMDVHVSRFFNDFDPLWEFRGFVSEGKVTALTAYNPWVYDPEIKARKDEILAAIRRVWDEADPSIRSDNYTLDFAVSRDVSQVYIVELNNFLPPLSGSCLFEYANEHDREIIFNGPFEFRIKETPTTLQDFVHVRTDEKTGKEQTSIMQPAPPHWMLMAENIRREACESSFESLPPLTRLPRNPFLPARSEDADGQARGAAARERKKKCSVM